MLEAARGLARLRNATALRAVSAALLLALQPIGFSTLTTIPDTGIVAPEDIGSLLALAGLLMLAGLIFLLLAVASWIMRVLAWGSVCRAGLRKFYCATRIVVLVAPIIGVLVIIGGSMYAVFQTFAVGGSFRQPGEEALGGLFHFILTGTLIMAAADFFEAVASLDLGQLYNVRLLAAASILYLAATAASIVAQAVNAAGWWIPLLSLIVFMLLTIGYHASGSKVRQQLLQPSPAAPTPGG